MVFVFFLCFSVRVHGASSLVFSAVDDLGGGSGNLCSHLRERTLQNSKRNGCIHPQIGSVRCGAAQCRRSQGAPASRLANDDVDKTHRREVAAAELFDLRLSQARHQSFAEFDGGACLVRTMSSNPAKNKVQKKELRQKNRTRDKRAHHFSRAPGLCTQIWAQSIRFLPLLLSDHVFPLPVVSAFCFEFVFLSPFPSCFFFFCKFLVCMFVFLCVCVFAFFTCFRNVGFAFFVFAKCVLLVSFFCFFTLFFEVVSCNLSCLQCLFSCFCSIGGFACVLPLVFHFWLCFCVLDF